jgi:hypothetical protein
MSMQAGRNSSKRVRAQNEGIGRSRALGIGAKIRGGVSRLSLPCLIPLPTKFHERVDDWGMDLRMQRAARRAPVFYLLVLVRLR